MPALRASSLARSSDLPSSALGEPVELCGALRGGQRPPVGERMLGACHRGVDLLDPGGGQLGDHLLGGGLDHV